MVELTAPESAFQGRLGLQQRVLPGYRIPFFDRLAGACRDGLIVYAGDPRPGEAILTSSELQVAQHKRVRNQHLLSGELYFCLQPGLLGALEESQPDALILEANPRYPSNMRAADWMRNRSRPVIGWGLGAPPLRGRTRAIRGWFRGRLLARMDALIAYSSLGKQQYLDAGLRAEQVFVAPNAVSPPPGPLAERPPKDGQPLRILFVGRLQARKRVDLLLRACAALALQPPPDVWIVGDGPARGDLERLAEAIYPVAQFTGSLQGPALLSAFSSADLFVLPGTGGLAVQQAMAHGLPVVVAEGDGTQRDLVRASNGWLTPPDDLVALVDALGEALSDPQRLRVMGRRSHEIVSEEVNIDMMVEAFLRALRTVTGAS